MFSDCLAFAACHDIVALADGNTASATAHSIWPPVAPSLGVVPGEAESVAPAGGAVRIGIVGSAQCAANYDDLVCSGYTPFVTAQIVQYMPLTECPAAGNHSCWQKTESARVDGGGIAWRQSKTLDACAQMCTADFSCTGFTFSANNLWGDDTTCELVGTFRDGSPAVVVPHEVCL